MLAEGNLENQKAGKIDDDRPSPSSQFTMVVDGRNMNQCVTGTVKK